jgi:glutamate dehydrogenase/leucine dehydrogenase
MLLRFLLRRRKKNYVPSLKDYPAPTSIIPDPDSFTKQNNMGRYLDQLERISKLRDTGTLTEEEFLKQKHIILENGN